MEQLITDIASKMGISQELSRKAVSLILSLVQSQGEKGPVGQLFDKMPGAGDLAAKGATALESGGSGGGLMGLVGGMLGGGGGDIMTAVSQLQAEGLDTSKIKDLGNEVLNHAREKGGSDLVDQITKSIPGLDKML